MQFQPSEIARVILIIYLSWTLSRKGERLKDFTHGYLPPLVAVCLFAGLVAVEPSLGCAVALFIAGLVLVFAAGARLRHLAATVGVACVGAGPASLTVAT